MRNGNYILVKAPAEYPGKKYRGRYCYEHHLVFWQNTKMIPLPGYIIHHLNHNRHDNRFENLEMIHLASHNTIHNTKNRRIPLVCSYCKSPFLREPKQYNHFRERGQTNFYCCKDHHYLNEKAA